MSAIVEAWMMKLGKLKERVRPRIAHSCSSTSMESPKKGETEGRTESPPVAAPSPAMAVDNRSGDDGLSEATVCMLMDRFVPW